MTRQRARQVEWLVVIALFIGINLLSQLLQEPITINNGHGWDGAIYFQVAEQLASGVAVNAEAPFVYRIGTPLLVAKLFPNDLMFGFKAVNVVGNLVAVLLLVIWLRQFLQNWRLRVLLVFLFMVMWLGPVRFVYFYPVYTDPWLFVALLGGLLGIHSVRASARLWKLCALSLLVCLGVLFREVAIVIAVATPFVRNPIPFPSVVSGSSPGSMIEILRQRISLAFLIPIAGAICGYIVLRLFATQDNSYSFLATTVQWAYNKPLLSYVHAWFITFGPLIVIPFFFWRASARFLARNQYVLIYLLCFSVLAWIGGTDTERILFWAAPAVYVVLGTVIEENAERLQLGLLSWASLLLLQLVSARAFWTVPSATTAAPTPWPLMTIWSNDFQYLDLFSYFGDLKIEAVSLLQYLFVSALLVWWLNRRVRKAANRQQFASFQVSTD